jgi:hypothetical protein
MQVAITVRTVENKFPGGTLAGNWDIDLALSSDPGTITDSYEGASPSHTATGADADRMTKPSCARRLQRTRLARFQAQSPPEQTPLQLGRSP